MTPSGHNKARCPEREFGERASESEAERFGESVLLESGRFREPAFVLEGRVAHHPAGLLTSAADVRLAFTVAGTVPDSHRVPYSPAHERTRAPNDAYSIVSGPSVAKRQEHRHLPKVPRTPQSLDFSGPT